MTYKATAAENKRIYSYSGFKANMARKEYDTLRHNVKGGYYTKNHLNMITWHENGQQRLVVTNDASGTAWKQIRKEK